MPLSFTPTWSLETMALFVYDGVIAWKGSSISRTQSARTKQEGAECEGVCDAKNWCRKYERILEGHRPAFNFQPAIRDPEGALFCETNPFFASPVGYFSASSCSKLR